MQLCFPVALVALVAALCAAPVAGQTGTVFPTLMYDQPYPQELAVTDIADGVNVEFADQNCTDPQFEGTVAAGKITVMATNVDAKWYRLCNKDTGAALSAELAVFVRDDHTVSPLAVTKDDTVRMTITGSALGMEHLTLFLGPKGGTTCALATASATLCDLVAVRNSAVGDAAPVLDAGSYPLCLRSKTFATDPTPLVGPVYNRSKLTVYQYGATPTVAVAGVAIPLKITGAPCDASTTVLSVNADCSTSDYVSNTCADGIISNPVPTIPTAGTVYVCLLPNTTGRLDAAKRINAGTIVVAPLPTATFAPTTIVRALQTTVSLESNFTDTVHLAQDNTCATVFLTLTVNGTSSFVLPPDGPTAGIATFAVCLTMTDGSVYPVGTVGARDYAVEYPGLVAGLNRTVGYDAATEDGTELTVVSGTNCSEGLQGTYAADAAKTFLRNFTAAGNFSLCVRTNATEVHAVSALQVWPHPSVTPARVIPLVALSVAVADVYVGAPVRIMTECTAAAALVTTAMAGPSPLAVAVTFPAYGVYKVCVDYPTHNASTDRIEVGEVAAVLVTHAPVWHSVAQPSTVTVNLNDDGNDKFFLSTSATCAPAPTDAADLFNFTSATVAAITPPVTGNFTGCLRATLSGVSRDIPTGVVAVLSPFTLRWAEPHSPLAFVPLTPVVTHPDYAPASAIIVAGNDTCGGTVLATMALDSSGVGAGNVSIANQTVSVCASAPDGVGYVKVGAVALEHFTLQTTTAISGQAAYFFTQPPLPDGLRLALTTGVCGDASATEFAVTNETAVAGIPYATGYRLCVSDAGRSWVAGSEPVLSFVLPFSATAPALIRKNVPATFGVTSNRSPPRVYLVQAADAPCVMHLDAPTTFFDAPAASTDVAVTVPERGAFTVCAVAADGAVAMAVHSGTALPYLVPAELAKGVTTTARSGTAVAPSEARIAFDAACTLPVGPTSVAIDAAGDFSVAIPSAVAASTAYYVCERPSAAGAWVAKDTVGLLDGFVVAPSAFQPGVAPNFTVTPAGAGENPFFSPHGNCSAYVNASLPVFPAHDAGTVEYYVCVTSVPGGTNYTTAAPQASFAPYVLQPTALVAVVPTAITLTPDQARDVHLSTTAACDARFLTFRPGAASAVAVGQTGTVYACVETTPEAPGVYVAVASLVSYATPVATVGPAVHRLPLCMNLTLPGAQYSLYGQAPARTVFLAPAADGCGDASKAVWTQALGATEQQECAPTAALTAGAEYALCVPTPAGHTNATTDPFVFAAATMTPTSVVTGTLTAITVGPAAAVQSGTETFAIATATDCATRSVAWTPSTAGLADVVIPASMSGGNHSLCMLGPDGAWAYVGVVIDVAVPHYFAVTSEVVPVATPTTLLPLLDLTYGMLRGFSTSDTCSPVTNDTVQLWPSPTVAGAFVVNNTDTAATGPRYLCALAPVNQTLVVAANITFLAAIMDYTATHPACVAQPLSYSTFFATDAAATNASSTVSLYNGDCCVRSGFDLDTNSVAGTATSTGGAGFSAAVDRDKYNALAGSAAANHTFRVCVTNPAQSLCRDAGPLLLTRTTACDDTPTPTGSTDPAYLGGAAPGTDDEQLSLLLVLGIVFLVLLCLCILCVVGCVWWRRTREIPKDEEEPEEGWDTFVDRRANMGAREGQDETLHDHMKVPADMELMTCVEEPLVVLEVQEAEDQEREQIMQAEQMVLQRLLATFEAETEDLRARIHAEERAEIEREANNYWRREMLNIEDVEEEARDVIRSVEDEERLALNNLETEYWRTVSVTREEEIKAALDKEERARSRKRRLLESSSAMMAHIDQTALLREVSPSRPLGEGEFSDREPEGEDEGEGPAEQEGQAADPFASIQRRQSLFAAMAGDPDAVTPAPQTPQERRNTHLMNQRISRASIAGGSVLTPANSYTPEDAAAGHPHTRRSVAIVPTKDNPFSQPAAAVVVHPDDTLNPFRPADEQPAADAALPPTTPPFQRRPDRTPSVTSGAGWEPTVTRGNTLAPLGPPRRPSDLDDRRGQPLQERSGVPLRHGSDDASPFDEQAHGRPDDHDPHRPPEE